MSRKPRRGVDLLHDPLMNKGTAFTPGERDALGLRGLLPPRVFDLRQQVDRVLENFDNKPTDLERYIHLISLQDRNETLFYRVLVDNIERMMPIVYTPTVGEACKKYGHIFRRPRGLYITAEDRGRIAEILGNWPLEAQVIVVTDGERILGLGDLGAHGMGIPIGKLSLYTALAGVHPAACLPVQIDVGTDNEDLRRDPLYTGLLQERVRSDQYLELMDEFMEAVQEAFPGCLVQFEDFATRNAISLLARYRDRYCTFNDDIQGTAAVTLAGILSAERITGNRLRDETILFFGAGSAATGIGHLIVTALEKDGLDHHSALERCWFVDSTGLIVSGRDDLAPHKKPFAHDHEFLDDLPEIIRALRPTALIGVSGQGGSFTEEVLRAMRGSTDRPIVFALSNPTANSECTAREAYTYTDGKAVFASGSPFEPVEYEGRRFVPGQGNNAYIFPGIGLGVLASGARRVTESMFDVAARTLAEFVHEDRLEVGAVFPPLRVVRDVSCRIAAAVVRTAGDEGLTDREVPDDAESFARSWMFEPEYGDYLA